MATYKVPQDVEAEDKLIGPFGFRQFIYLAIAAGSGFMVYVLWQVFPLLAIIPMPICALFIIISLPLRKEQPMETYLIAVMRFLLKPHLRLWNPDGTISYVEIVAPRAVTQSLAKDLSADSAVQKLDYLSRVMDSRGWALKGAPLQTSSISSEVAAEAEHAVDVFDNASSAAQSFSTMIAKQDEDRRQAAMDMMQKVSAAPTATGQATVATPHYDPYPSSMHQRVVQPTDKHHQTKHQELPKPAPEPPKAPVPPPVSPDIIRLANNDDLSISAIAHEAHRLTGGEDEVVINLH